MSTPVITPEETLAAYTDTILKLDQLRASKEALRAGILTQEIKDQLQAIDEEIDPKIAALSGALAMVEEQLRTVVLDAGVKKVSGTTHTATIIPGRTSWDTKVLDGMAVLIPQIQAARKTGSPSVRITVNKA